MSLLIFSGVGNQRRGRWIVGSMIPSSLPILDQYKLLYVSLEIIKKLVLFFKKSKDFLFVPRVACLLAEKPCSTTNVENVVCQLSFIAGNSHS